MFDFGDFIQIILAIILTVFTLIILTLLAIALWFIIEKMLLLRASRVEAQKRADVHIVTNDGQVYIRDTNHKAYWLAAHLNQNVYANGKYQVPSQTEMDAWLYFHKPTRETKRALQLPARSTQGVSKTFYEILDTTPHLMLVGGTGSGKTTLINKAIEHLAEKNPSALVGWLSTHAALDLRDGNIPASMPVKQEPDEIVEAIQEIYEIYEYRRNNPGNYPKLILAMDEWPELIEINKEAGRYLRLMSRGARKTNITLILASHGSGVKDLGISGYQSVKQDFAEIHLVAGQYDKARMGKEEILLPGSIIDLETTEQQVKRMWAEGKSKREISKAIWGGHGSYYNERIERIANE